MYHLSIITINRNNADGLEKTIASVAAQRYENIEYIVIDGGSSDRSVDVIRSYSSRIRYWHSEPDTGIYNAMNKGLQHATGDYTLFLNSGDYLEHDEVIERVFAAMDGEDACYGNIGIYQQGKIKVMPSAPVITYHRGYQHNLPPQPALFVRTSLLRQLGGFDERYRIIADVALISRLFSTGTIRYRHIDMPVTIFDMHGVSSDRENQQRIYEERKKFIIAEFPHYLADFEAVYKSSFWGRVRTKLKACLCVSK